MSTEKKHLQLTPSVPDAIGRVRESDRVFMDALLLELLFVVNQEVPLTLRQYKLIEARTRNLLIRAVDRTFTENL